MANRADPVRSVGFDSVALRRIERLVVVVAIIGLAVTGLPQKFAIEPWARALFVLLGGIESARILHRFLAILLIAESIYHVAALGYRAFVYGLRPGLFPGLRDFGAGVKQFLRNLGLGSGETTYGFALKWEYVLLFISVLILIVTGLILWNPIAVTSTLPGETVPLARSVHGDQAILLVAGLVLLRVGIFLWRPRRESETVSSPAPSERVEQRRRTYLPVAAVGALLIAVGLFVFTTSQTTAIHTVPRQHGVVYAPQGLDEVGDPVVGAALWSTLRCSFCHGAEATGGVRGEPSLRRPDLTFEAFFQQVRVGSETMPAFSPEELPDGYLIHLWVWLTAPQSP
ncbi:MAG: c-type cytochrome [Anaerolineae bacterium]|nr:c-type cytochrome [Anaerolineae bacterium]